MHEEPFDLIQAAKIIVFVFVGVPLYAITIWIILNFIEETLR